VWKIDPSGLCTVTFHDEVADLFTISLLSNRSNSPECELPGFFSFFFSDFFLHSEILAVYDREMKRGVRVRFLTGAGLMTCSMYDNYWPVFNGSIFRKSL